jgi:hypothetical protein
MLVEGHEWASVMRTSDPLSCKEGTQEADICQERELLSSGRRQ